MSYSSTVKTDCLLWYADFKTPIKVQRMFRAKYGRNVKPPSEYCVKRWVENFKKTGSSQQRKSGRTDGDAYLRLLNDDFFPVFSTLQNGPTPFFYSLNFCE